MKALRILGIALAALVVIGIGLYVSGYGGTLLWQGFLAYNSPSGNFDPAQAVTAPDYGDAANWAALPDKSDPADLAPIGVTVPPQGQQPVDTFFIHPTGYLKSANWTSPMEPNSGTEENTLWMMANQASAYNGCCNIYAPRYREATIFSYFGAETERDRVLGFAYEDVKRAFEYYLANYNQGRPFIIATHSQGSHHALRLLSEVIDPSDLHHRMVAAYLIGAVVIPVSPTWFAGMTHITPCQRADDLGCVVHWDTMPEGAAPMARPEPSLCTNPLSWQVNETRVDASHNEGAVVPAGTYNAAFGRSGDTATGQQFTALSAPMPGQTWAQCQDGTLFVRKQDGTGFEAMGSGDLGSYHGLDYALFYMNIHNNAKLRTERYLSQALSAQ